MKATREAAENFAKALVNAKRQGSTMDIAVAKLNLDAVVKWWRDAHPAEFVQIMSDLARRNALANA